jgi:hypothetical protein
MSACTSTCSKHDSQQSLVLFALRLPDSHSCPTAKSRLEIGQNHYVYLTMTGSLCIVGIERNLVLQVIQQLLRQQEGFSDSFEALTWSTVKIRDEGEKARAIISK